MIKTDRYVQTEAAGMLYRLIPVTEEIIRCVIGKEEIKGNDSLIIEKKEYPAVEFAAEENEEKLELKTGKVLASLELSSGRIEWKHADGTRWCIQDKADLTKIDVVRYTTGGEKPVINRVKTVDGERNFIQNLKPEKVRDGYRARVFFDWKEEEEIHGLGQAEEGIYNYRGHNQYLYQHNMRIPMPLFVSTEGYGVLFDCCSLMTFNDEGRESYLIFGYSGSDRLLFHGRQYHGWNYPCLSLFDRQGADAAEVGLWLYPVQGAILYFQRIRGNCTPLQRNRGSAGLCGSGLEYLGSGQLGGEDSGSVPLWG